MSRKKSRSVSSIASAVGSLPHLVPLRAIALASAILAATSAPGRADSLQSLVQRPRAISDNFARSPQLRRDGCGRSNCRYRANRSIQRHRGTNRRGRAGRRLRLCPSVATIAWQRQSRSRVHPRDGLPMSRDHHLDLQRREQTAHQAAPRPFGSLRLLQSHSAAWPNCWKRTQLLHSRGRP